VNKDHSLNYDFENEFISYNSYVNGFTSDIYNKFDDLAKEISLSARINDLFIGNKVNISENRAAFHPKYRNEYNSFNKKNKFYKLFKNASNIVTIGIGGSYEGPKLLIESIGKKSRNYIFVTGSDEEEFQEKIDGLKIDETIFIISSKSFKTTETIRNLKKAISWSGDLEKFIAITSNKFEASKYNIKNIIEFDIEIGGRYSIWSDISLIAEWENKKELKENFIMGGRQADIDLHDNDDYFKFVKHLSYSDIWLHNIKNRNSRAVLSYVWKFRSLPDYTQQLEMESLGKQPNKKSKYKKTGQIIFGGYGPTAQHSYFQLLHQGTHNICADIIACRKDKTSLSYAQAITQSRLLSNGANDDLKDVEVINGNVPVNFFIINNDDSFTLGYLIATWEHRTFITASMLEINPFDQFGVNAGKIYTNKFLQVK